MYLHNIHRNSCTPNNSIHTLLLCIHHQYYNILYNCSHMIVIPFYKHSNSIIVMYYGQVKQHILILVVVKMKRMIYGHKNYIVLVYVIQVILLSSLVYAQERCVYTVYQLVCYSYTHHEMTIHHCETDSVFCCWIMLCACCRRIP
jgi:hypothetical protein